MKKMLLGLFLIVLTSPAFAQVNPKVAYNLYNVLYIANADGSSSQAVYTGASNITFIDLKPGGGQIAFIESNTLKLLDYTVGTSSVQVVGVRAVNNPSVNTAEWADYSPNASKIIYLERSSRSAWIHTVDPTTAADGGRISSDLGMLNFLRFIGGTGDQVVFARYDYNSTTAQYNLDMWTYSLSTTTPTQVMSGLNGLTLQDLDVSRKRQAVLFQVGAPSNMYDCDFSTPSASMTLSQCRNMGAGMRAHYTNDDSGILYDDNSRSNLWIKNLSTGISTALLKKGTKGINYSDYQPDLVP